MADFIKVDIAGLGSQELDVVVERLHGEERISRPFLIELELETQDLEPDFSKIMGKAAAVTFWDRDLEVPYRHVHGLVTRFAQAGLRADSAVYRVEIRPILWTLGLGAQSRIFQEKTAPEIIGQVLKDQGLTDYKLQTKGTFDKRDFCVQYNETDLDFVSRLMEEEGIYYYFVHDKSQHWMVIADAPSGYGTVEGEPLQYGVFEVGDSVNSVIRCTYEQNLVTEKVVFRDYNFETPATPLSVQEKTITKQKLSTAPELYFYPGGFSKTAGGKTLAVRRIEGLEATHTVLRGDSLAPYLEVGAKVELKDHYREEFSGKYAILALLHQFSNDSYENHFEAIPAGTSYRPAHITPRPVIAGAQTAKVVGAKNTEVYTDKYGRVKVQFHWDREGKFDDKASCWVRVAQGIAGQQWGQIWLPRVGQEVVVTFEEGDPDRPLITGSVYNADNMPPYTLPDDHTKSGLKTRSLDKGKAKNFNELRFDDKIGKEEIYFHAERDFNRVVENDDTLKVGFEAKDKGNQTIDIFNDRTVTLDKGKDTLTIKTGDRAVLVDKGNLDTTLKMGDLKFAVKAGAATLEAAKSILLKVGGSTIKLEPMGITIKATKISAAADLKAEIKGVMVDVAGSAMLTLKGGLLKIN